LNEKTRKALIKLERLVTGGTMQDVSLSDIRAECSKIEQQLLNIKPQFTSQQIEQKKKLETKKLLLIELRDIARVFDGR